MQSAPTICPRDGREVNVRTKPMVSVEDGRVKHRSN